MMIISSLLYAAIFGHVTTIIHNMTQATAKYHEMLDAVRQVLRDLHLSHFCKKLLAKIYDKDKKLNENLQLLTFT
jgi:hypothetical protein